MASCDFPTEISNPILCNPYSGVDIAHTLKSERRIRGLHPSVACERGALCALVRHGDRGTDRSGTRCGGLEILFCKKTDFVENVARRVLGAVFSRFSHK